MRGDDEGATVNLVVDTVKPVDNCNIIDISLTKKPSFEMLMAMKDFLAQNNGSDPVIFNIQNNDKPTKILINSKFWVNTTNDFMNSFKTTFDEVGITMRSLDEKPEIKALV